MVDNYVRSSLAHSVPHLDVGEERMKFGLTISLAVAAVIASVDASDYVFNVIDCNEDEEAVISELYDSFLTLLTERKIEENKLKIPEELSMERLGYVIVSRSFYVPPNELRGFELVIPALLTERKDGYYTNLSSLGIDSIEVKQGIQILVLKKETSNQLVETTEASSASH